jgi:hypothetical protein
MYQFLYIGDQQGEPYLNEVLNVKEAKVDICEKQKLVMILSLEK